MESPGSIEYRYVFGFPVTWDKKPNQASSAPWRGIKKGEGGERGSKVLNEAVSKKEVPLSSDTLALSILLSRFQFLFPSSSFFGSAWGTMKVPPLSIVSISWSLGICPALSLCQYFYPRELTDLGLAFLLFFWFSGHFTNFQQMWQARSDQM